MLGVKPPRYPTLWEACVNAIVFQQVSLSAASWISRHLVEALGVPIECGALKLHMFPTAESLQGANDVVLSATGLSANKLAALRRVAEALLTGTLDEAMLEALPSPDAVALLCRIKGIGPWTATVILLRGLGRLDVFPMNDSSVVRNLELVGGVDVDHVLDALGPQRRCSTIICYSPDSSSAATWARSLWHMRCNLIEHDRSEARRPACRR